MTAAAAPRIPLQDRLAALTPRERVFLATGAGALLLFLIYLLLPGGGEEPVELTRSPPVQAPAAPPPPVAPAPVTTAAPVSAEGYVLHGLLGGGSGGAAAIIGTATGGQRLVRVGRPVGPGLVLTEVGQRHALLSSAAGDFRLEFNKPAASVSPAAAPSAAAVAPSFAASAPQAAPGHKRATLEFRLGLQPRKAGGRITGFAVRPGANLPMLQRAGLQPGDVLVAVNGQPFESEEKVLELSQEIAGSYTAEFEFERGGRRMKTSMPVNPKR